MKKYKFFGPVLSLLFDYSNFNSDQIGTIINEDGPKAISFFT